MHEFKVGDPVIISIQDAKILGNIRAQILANYKVRYSVSVKINNEEEDRSTLHNIDSALIKYNPNGSYVDFGDDNYS